MSLLKGAIIKKRKVNKVSKTDNTIEPLLEPLCDKHHMDSSIEKSKNDFSKISIDFDHTRIQLEMMTDAENKKIYIAKDGGMYVGNEFGCAELKAGINPIFVSERRFENLKNKKSNALYVIQCIDADRHTYYKLFCNGITILNSSEYTNQDIDDLLRNKQNKLESGKNIKTINNKSILGKGNINIPGIEGIGVKSIEVIEESDYEELAHIDPYTLYIIIADRH